MSGESDSLSEPARLRSIVSELVVAARTKAGNAERLAAALEGLGVGGERGPYSISAVSNWVQGRTMPPADVLLAVSLVAEESIDQRLRPQGALSRDDDDSQLRSEVARLQAEMRHLYARIGEPYDDQASVGDGARKTGTG